MDLVDASDSHVPDKTGLIKPRINYKAIKSEAGRLQENARLRRMNPKVVSDAVENYDKFCSLLPKVNDLRKLRNETAERMKAHASGQAKLTSQEMEKAKAQTRTIKAELSKLETDLRTVEDSMLASALEIPNYSHLSSPVGNEENAKVVWTRGTPVTEESAGFPLLDHLELSQRLNLVDFEAGAAVTGSSWYYLRREAALLELALIQYAMSRATAKGFMPVITPDVVQADVAMACGFQPRTQEGKKEAGQIYRLDKEVTGTRSPELCLVGTAEIPLAGMHLNKIIPADQLPLKTVAFGRSFRAESGARGAESRGLYRVHQFSKVELFAVTAPKASDAMLESMVDFQAELFGDLGLCIKLLDMPTEELGASAYRKYDIEAWMPGRNGWGEISSASNCTEYQARRLNIRYGNGETAGFAHTLNGTAMAVPRMLIAILETFQNKDGSVDIPKVLRPFVGNMEVIRR